MSGWGSTGGNDWRVLCVSAQVRSADPKPVWGTTCAASLSFTHITFSSQKDHSKQLWWRSSIAEEGKGVWLNKHNNSNMYSTKYRSVAVTLSYGSLIYTVKRFWMLKPHLKMCDCYCIKTDDFSGYMSSKVLLLSVLSVVLSFITYLS